MSSDPVNPTHYAGRACADIGERLSANGYQILKYVWRLGKKDAPAVELGKALWYLDSEDMLLAYGMHAYQDVRVPEIDDLDDSETFMEQRIAYQSDFTKTIARMLWHGYDREKLRLIREAIAKEKAHHDAV